MTSSIEQAKEVLKIEAEGILKLIDRMDHHFEEMVDLIYQATGRLIISGIGKSGIVGRKIVATLNSTGTRSLFLHPVEAMHGDLGMVSQDDVFLALSNSGETDELNLLVPSIRKIGCRVIAFTGNLRSTLAEHSDIVIDVSVEREACPLGLAPTASTTALLAMGDALAVVLINRKHFNGVLRWNSIRWVNNMQCRLASCTRGGNTDGEIRISARIKDWPGWVVDYVIAHELMHRRHPNHSQSFWDELSSAYPLTERARGFIHGMGFAAGQPLEDD